MTISETIVRRGINEVLHFTTNCGVVGTLASKALLSRYLLPENKHLEHILYVNAANRPEAEAFFDKTQNWLNYVNLSISEINRRYFDVSQRWHVDNHIIWWSILAFDPIIMTHPNVVFATTNNSYDLCARSPDITGLDALFAPLVRRKSQTNWSATRGNRTAELPTCEQAEVLYPGSVPIEFLRRIYVRKEEEHDRVTGWLDEFGFPDIEVVLSPQKFDGKQN